MLRLAVSPPSTPLIHQLRARTFHMTMNDVVKDTNIVVGTLPLNSVHAKVLIDSGATKSFISGEFASKLNYEIQLLIKALTIEIAKHDRLPVNQVFPHCGIKILEHHFLC